MEVLGKLPVECCADVRVFVLDVEEPGFAVEENELGACEVVACEEVVCEEVACEEVVCEDVAAVPVVVAWEVGICPMVVGSPNGAVVSPAVGVVVVLALVCSAVCRREANPHPVWHACSPRSEPV